MLLHCRVDTLDRRADMFDDIFGGLTDEDLDINTRSWSSAFAVEKMIYAERNEVLSHLYHECAAADVACAIEDAIEEGYDDCWDTVY